MSKRHIDLPTKSITFDRCSSTMTGLPVLTIWKRQSHIMPCKAGIIMLLQKFSTYYSLLMNGEILAESILHVSSNLRTSDYSAPCHHGYIMWDTLMSVECVEVSNWPHSEMHQKICEFPTSDNYSMQKLKRTGAWGSWTGAWIWSECAPWQYIH